MRWVVEPGKLREELKLPGLFNEWQCEGKSVLPLVRLFFVGRGRAGKTTTLRPVARVVNWIQLPKAERC